MVKKNEKLKKDSKNVSVPRLASSVPPVVAVLGHVDHGKTTLLDSINKTNIAQKEHGGITQKIGASSIEILHEGIKRKITFIDTPGHEAFVSMRGRGTQAADIGLLVISSVDGIMPQTKESIALLLGAKIPFIVVLTKVDLPDKNVDKIKQQLAKEGVMLEEYGGDIPVIEVSAKTNLNIKELLELILLVFEVKKDNSSVSQEGQFKAIVIESKLDQKAGPRATIVVKNGMISVRDKIVCDGVVSRIRGIINDKGEHLQRAGIGDAVEILGLEKVSNVGSIFLKKGEQDLVQQSVIEKEETPDSTETNSLSAIICADTLGSLDAIVNAMPKGVFIASQKTGDVSASDVSFAKSIGAIILAFNTKIKPDALKLVQQDKVMFKNYNLIYEMISEIKDVLEGKRLALVEEIYGVAKVLASFPFEKTKVMGISVLDGRIARGDKVRIVSPSAEGDKNIGESTISSVRIGKEVVSKAEKGKEAGIIISPFIDFTIGDMLICHG